MLESSPSPSVAEVIEILCAGSDRAPERLGAALDAGERLIAAERSAVQAREACGQLRAALLQVGRALLEGGDPQALEDALLASHPDTPLSEHTLRRAWLAISDHLARSGDRPAFGGSGTDEAWAFAARSRPWPFVCPAGVADPVERAADLFGQGLAVVVVRGPGRSSFLAALRRRLLGRHGAQAVVSPVIAGADDDPARALRPLLTRSRLDSRILKVLEQIRYGEDLIGALGRAGDRDPVALLVDDAHLQSRALLLGTPLFLEPAPGRDALLVLTAPAGADNALAEIIDDARDRGVLHELRLPELDTAFAAAMLGATLEDVPAGWAERLGAAGGSRDRPAQRLAVAHAWLPEAVAAAAAGGGAQAELGDRLGASVDLEGRLPAPPRALEALCLAALEGTRSFHGLTVGALVERDEDFVEDLLFDDELELDGQRVGTCEGVVQAAMRWSNLPDGLHPVFAFHDARFASALRARLENEAAAEGCRVLRDALLQAYGPRHVWQVADRVWHLDVACTARRHPERLLLGQLDAHRAEAGFQRLLPILQTEKPYRLALARLYGAGMEIGGVAAVGGRVALADQGFQAAAAAAQRLGRAGAAGEALARLGELRLALSLPEPANRALEVAERLLAEGGHSVALRRLGLLRAEVALVAGDLDRASERLSATIDTLQAAGDPAHAALGMLRLGRIRYEQGRVAEARALLGEAQRSADAGSDPRAVAASRMAAAFVATEEGELEQAYELLQQAARAFTAAGMAASIAEVAAAGLQRRSGEPKAAEQRLRQAAAAFKKAGAAIQWADAWQEVGRALNDQHHHHDARAVLRDVLPIRQRARDRFGLVRLHEDLAAACRGQHDATGALAELGRARRLAQRLGMARRLGALDADLAQMIADLDGEPQSDAEEILAAAIAAIDELEALWAASPQAAPPTDQVH